MTKCDILYVTLVHDSRQFRFFQKNSNFPEEYYVHRKYNSVNNVTVMLVINHKLKISSE